MPSSSGRPASSASSLNRSPRGLVPSRSERSLGHTAELVAALEQRAEVLQPLVEHGDGPGEDREALRCLGGLPLVALPQRT
jgi:hypothetical protein